MKRTLLSCLCLALLTLTMAVTPAFAGPAIMTPLQVKQPDGTALQVQIRGDEYQNWTELAAGGQTVVRNPVSKAWEYAELRSDGTLKASGIKAEPGGKNAPPSMTKGLKPSRNLALEQHMPAKMAALPGGVSLPPPAVGERKVLVVLVNFSNRVLMTTPDGWYGKIFDTTTGVKSMVNFYNENSRGLVTVSPVMHSQPGNPPGIVTVRIPEVHPDYGGWISYASDVMVASEAIYEASSYVDFDSYDTNGDGVLEPSELAIYFIYAGYEASGTYVTPSVWGHAWWGGTVMAGTKIVHYWALNGELNGFSKQHPIGVMIHELGHALFGLIDLYDTNGVNAGLGWFSTMAGGSWGFDVNEDPATTPTALDLWSRQYLSWVSPVEYPLAAPVTLPPSLSSEGIRTWQVYPNYQEYFLVENRQPVGWDRGVRAFFGPDWRGGLLVLHVDDSIPDNGYVAGSHQRVVPVQADSSYCDMLAPRTSCWGYPGTLFYAANNDAWGPDTAPNSDFYDGLKSGVTLKNISVPMSLMTASYNPDSIPPQVTEFALPATSESLTVPVLNMSASDNLEVRAYCLTEYPTPPAASDRLWQADLPVQYTFTGTGPKTLYAWAMDRAENISAPRSATVMVTEDTTPPVVTEFAIPATSSNLTVPINTLAATDNAGVTGYLVSEIPLRPLASDPAWSAVKPTSHAFMRGGSRTLYAWAKDGAGNVSDSRSATVTIYTVLPPPWVSRDVGITPLAGSASFANGVFTLKGSGANIAGDADAFHFVYKPMVGDFQIIARVASLQNTNGWAKAGVMIRQSFDANSMHALMAVTPENGAQFSYRNMTGGTTAAISKAGMAPCMVKLVRQGNTVTGYVCNDGMNWIKAGTTTTNMRDLVYVGMVVTSHNNAALCATTMDGVVMATDTMPPTVTAFSIPATSKSLEVPINTFTATDNVGVTGYLLTDTSAKPSADDPRWSSMKPYSFTFTTDGKNTLYAWAKDADGNVSNSRAATVTITLPLPSGWYVSDVGAAGTPSVSYLYDTFTVNGSGAGVGGTADSFRYVYMKITGPGMISARVASVASSSTSVLAGVMMRESLLPDSKFAMMALIPGSGKAEFASRGQTGEAAAITATSNPGTPYYVKVVREGNTLTGYVSSDQTSWTKVGSSTDTMSGTIYIGLVVTSQNRLSTAKFNDLCATAFY